MSRPDLFQPEREAMPVAELRTLQLSQLQTMVARQYEHVPAYRARFEAEGVRPDDLRSLSDLARFPLTRKTDLRDNYPLGLVATGRENLRRIHASSGTTGKPTVVAYDDNDLNVFAEVVARSLYAAGGRPGMVFHNAYGYGLFTGGLGTDAGGRRLGLNTVPVSGGGTERQIQLIQDLEPQIIACTPSYALVLAEALARQGMRPDDISLRYAVLGAEPWSDKTRQEVEARLGVRATNIYGLSEVIGPGVSNEDAREQRGSYIWEDHFYPEIVDPETGEVLPDGEWGVLVLSSMTRTALPILRYWTGDHHPPVAGRQRHWAHHAPHGPDSGPRRRPDHPARGQRAPHPARSRAAQHGAGQPALPRRPDPHGPARRPDPASRNRDRERGAPPGNRASVQGPGGRHRAL